MASCGARGPFGAEGRREASGGALSASGGALSASGGASGFSGEAGAGGIATRPSSGGAPSLGNGGASMPDTDASMGTEGGALPDAAPAPSVDAGTGDAGPFADCRCLPHDYRIEGTFGDAALVATAPYVLRVYCEEETVLVIRHPCTQLYRISGCSADGQVCVYVVADLDRGSAYGHVAEGGVTWLLTSSELSVGASTERLATGRLIATFQHADTGELRVLEVSYEACLARMRECG